MIENHQLSSDENVAFINFCYLRTPQNLRVIYFLTLNADQQKRRKKISPVQQQKNHLL